MRLATLHSSVSTGECKGPADMAVATLLQECQSNGQRGWSLRAQTRFSALQSTHARFFLVLCCRFVLHHTGSNRASAHHGVEAEVDGHRTLGKKRKSTARNLARYGYQAPYACGLVAPVARSAVFVDPFSGAAGPRQ